MTGMRRERNRRSIRLAGFDYTQPGAYFLTVCAARRECLFGAANDGVMYRNAIGDVIAVIDAVVAQHLAEVSKFLRDIVVGHGASVYGVAPFANKSNRA